MARVARGKGGHHSSSTWKGRSSFRQHVEEHDSSDDEDFTGDL
jgi:hypothetical protein